MSKKHFSVLAIFTIVAVLAATLLVPGRTGKDAATASGLLLPEVGQRINDVTRLTVIQAGNETAATLIRDAEQWRIAEIDGYPVDWEDLRELLRNLAQAEIIEYKTDNPAYYGRLGVEDVSKPDAAGLLLQLELGDEKLGLVVGNEASGREGQYVRLAGAARSALIDRVLDVPLEAIDWASREVIDVASYLVAEVEIIHPDGGWVLARKLSANDTDFVLDNIPAGREPVSSWAVNSLAGVFARLRMDSVRPDTGEPQPGAVRVRLQTFAGVEYLAEAWRDEDKNWLRLQATVPAAPFAPEGDEAAREAVEENMGQAAATNARVGGWAFEINASSYTAMTKRLDALLKPLEDQAAPGP